MKRTKYFVANLKLGVWRIKEGEARYYSSRKTDNKGWMHSVFTPSELESGGRHSIGSMTQITRDQARKIVPQAFR